MDVRHLLGFFLAIAGVGVGLLALTFTLNSQAYNKDFLFAIGGFAAIALLVGVSILNRR